MTGPADFDPAALLDALDRHRVDYLVVGGVAAAAYGAQRLTHDLDVVADYDGDNLDRLSSALAEVGVRIRADGLDDDIARALPAPNAERSASSRSRPGEPTWVTSTCSSRCRPPMARHIVTPTSGRGPRS